MSAAKLSTNAAITPRSKPDSGKRGTQPKTVVGKNPPPAQPKPAKTSTDANASVGK